MFSLSRNIYLNRGLKRYFIPQFISVCNKGGYKRSDTPSPDKDLLNTELFKDAPKNTSPLQPSKFVDDEIKKNHPERARYPEEYTDPFPKGLVYDKFPIKIPLEAERTYSFCTCGYSKRQPFCDGKHKTIEGTGWRKLVKKFRPLKFSVEESKDYYLCNCKQSSNRPYCDGTHKTLDQVPKTMEELEAQLAAEEAALAKEMGLDEAEVVDEEETGTDAKKT